MTSDARAQLDGENSLKLTALILELSVTAFEISPTLFLDLHRIAIAGTLKSPGEWRTAPRYVAKHIPPHWKLIPELMVEMCEHASGLACPWERSALLLWRTNWVHPFYDGNGRVARAIAFLALSTEMPPEGVRIITAITSAPNFGETLEKCDRIWLDGDRELANMDLHPISEFINDRWREVMGYV